MFNQNNIDPESLFTEDDLELIKSSAKRVGKTARSDLYKLSDLEELRDSWKNELHASKEAMDSLGAFLQGDEAEDSEIYVTFKTAATTYLVNKYIDEDMTKIIDEKKQKLRKNNSANLNRLPGETEKAHIERLRYYINQKDKEDAATDNQTESND